MVKKEFTFRGKTLADLQKMEIAEFAKLCKARPRRNLLRGVDKKVLKKMEIAAKAKKENKKPVVVRTHRRDLIIIPAMVGLLFGIYKGNSFETVEIKQEMLGHYLGEMVMTRKRLMHGKAGIGATRSSTAIATRK
jgi:small subunit ribosomal protein S19